MGSSFFNSLHPRYFFMFLSSADVFRNQFHWKILSGIPSEYQIIWIQIRLDMLSGLIWVHTVCKCYQQRKCGDKELILRLYKWAPPSLNVGDVHYLKWIGSTIIQYVVKSMQNIKNINELVPSVRYRLACAPIKDRSACTSVQSDQSLWWMLRG